MRITAVVLHCVVLLVAAAYGNLDRQERVIVAACASAKRSEAVLPCGRVQSQREVAACAITIDSRQGEPCWAPTRFSLADIPVLADTAGAGGMAPPTITGISARMSCVQEHSSPLKI